MVDTREAFDPATTAPHTGFQQAETALLILPQKNKMKQSVFCSTLRAVGLLSSLVLPFRLNLVGTRQFYLKRLTKYII